MKRTKRTILSDGASPSGEFVARALPRWCAVVCVVGLVVVLLRSSFSDNGQQPVVRGGGRWWRQRQRKTEDCRVRRRRGQDHPSSLSSLLSSAFIFPHNRRATITSSFYAPPALLSDAMTPALQMISSPPVTLVVCAKQTREYQTHAGVRLFLRWCVGV